ncbi:phosphomannomutase [Legionella geestiana]|uniref:phosphomannomutase n=1 Tax=Legionella geestiana TaxID=45065 RepID=A0A0W0U5R7_9GAMM|nr:phosphomannomutase/phosphoglucomutase [Legionella geestiana]KTD03078.1 phosphomannomutase [Legionella geestiana]QBS12980.1 phosphomannomutase/phosphoglucomutase [Legionella geestiana]QDQ39340.1 phosphomannomutase/phosphoglucomutase [Legionella geestiana]STX54513.1 phosphomannomutase [Legionella geestiana]
MSHTRYHIRPVESSVFRAYDIRGIVGETLDENAYYSFGRALAMRLQSEVRDTTFLARDGRTTGPALCDALAAGLTEGGIHVVNLGAIPTPLLYFAASTRAIDSGLMVTGSHNPAGYNGLKMVLAGKAQAGEAIQELCALVNAGEFCSGQGKLSFDDIRADYNARILADVKLSRPLKVVVDAGNGIAGPIIPGLLRALGCEVIPLYCEVDGAFPNHHPDPTVESNLLDLRAAVLAHQADIGLAFDGDGDRLGVLDEKGRIIWPDRLLMCYAREILGRRSGARIVYDVKCSAHLGQVIEASGGVPVMCPTGHSLVKAVMKREAAALAGEMSGHIFFGDRWYGFDDALYSACRLLEIVSRSDKTLSEQFADIPDSINTPEIQIAISDAEKFAYMQRFCAEARFPGARTVTIDGLRVEYGDGWGLLRASNTTPCLVARFEADSAAAMERIQSAFREQMQRVSSGLQVPF